MKGKALATAFDAAADGIERCCDDDDGEAICLAELFRAIADDYRAKRGRFSVDVRIEREGR